MSEQTVKTYEVSTPSTHFTGERYGVEFRDGTARATKEQAQYLEEAFGYTVEWGDAEETPVAVTPEASVRVLDGIGAATAKKLEDAGVVTIAALAAADVAELSQKSGLPLDKLTLWHETAKNVPVA